MTSFATLHTGQFIIKPRLVKRARLWRAMLCVVTLLALYAVFEAGRALAGYSVTDALQMQWRLRQRVTVMEAENQRLQHELSSAQMTVQMDQKATSTLQSTLSDVQNNLQKQNEELAFYRGIVAPQLNASTQPTLQRLEILPGNDAQHFRLHLVLIQSAQVTTQAQGSVAVTVVGELQGQPAQLTLRQLAPALAVDVLKFSYRYFQNMDQAIELPAGFEPKTVQVELRANAHPAQQQQFAWQTGAALQATPQVSS